MTFDPTNLRALEVLIVEGLHAIVPSLEAGRPWKHLTSPKNVAASQAVRQFFIEWGDSEQIVGGATGNLDYEIGADIVVTTDYGGLHSNAVGEVAVSDHWDANRHFVDRLDSVFGLTFWESQGHVALDSQRVEHLYRVQYMRR